MRIRRAPAHLLILALAAGCASAASRQALTLYDKGDYKGAAKLADDKLAGHDGDDGLWQVKIRALLAQGDRKGIAADYDRYRRARHGRDDAALLTDMATATLGQGLLSNSIEVRIQTIGYVEDLMLEQLADAVMVNLGSDDDRVAAAAAVAVLRGDPQAPHLLEELQNSDDPAARAIAVEGIGRKVGEHAGEDLRKAAADPDERVRAAAMAALANVPDDASTRSLAEGLGDKDPSVRAAAARSLASRKRGDLAGFARIALADQALNVRLAGVGLLAAAKDTAGLSALLASADPVVAVQAAAELHGADPTGAARAVDAALGSQDPAVRVGAINLMEAALGDDAAVDRARARLADSEVTVRLAAARVLGYHKHADEALPVVVAALGSTEHLSAAADLALLGDERGTDALSAAVMDGVKATDRARAASMHGSAHRVTPGLVAALADASGQVRVIAAYQLIKLTRSAD